MCCKTWTAGLTSCWTLDPPSTASSPPSSIPAVARWSSTVPEQLQLFKFETLQAPWRSIDAPRRPCRHLGKDCHRQALACGTTHRSRNWCWLRPHWPTPALQTLREGLPSPGVGLRHYAPIAKLVLVEAPLADLGGHLAAAASGFLGARSGGRVA